MRVPDLEGARSWRASRPLERRSKGKRHTPGKRRTLRRPQRRAAAARRRAHRATDQALKLVARENLACVEQLRLGFQQALRRLVGWWDEQLRVTERDRDQLLALIDHLLTHGWEPEAVRRAGELSAAVHQRVAENPLGPRPPVTLELALPAGGAPPEPGPGGTRLAALAAPEGRAARALRAALEPVLDTP